MHHTQPKTIALQHVKTPVFVTATVMMAATLIAILMDIAIAE